MNTPVQLLSASRQNLWRLNLIRMLVLSAQAGSVGLVWLLDFLPLPWQSLLVTLGMSLLLCLLTTLRLRGPWPVTEQEYAVQLGCDLMIHSLLLRMLDEQHPWHAMSWNLPLTGDEAKPASAPAT